MLEPGGSNDGDGSATKASSTKTFTFSRSICEYVFPVFPMDLDFGTLNKKFLFVANEYFGAMMHSFPSFPL